MNIQPHLRAQFPRALEILCPQFAYDKHSSYSISKLFGPPVCVTNGDAEWERRVIITYSGDAIVTAAFHLRYGNRSAETNCYAEVMDFVLECWGGFLRVFIGGS